MVVGNEIIYLRGQNADYQKKYAKFFEMQDAEPAKAQPKELIGANAEAIPAPKEPGAGSIPPSPGTTPGSEKSIEADLKKWRTVATRRAKEGKAQREFASDAIPESLRKEIAACLKIASTSAEVAAVFDAVACFEVMA